jgi:hypothetical protein
MPPQLVDYMRLKVLVVSLQRFMVRVSGELIFIDFLSLANVFYPFRVADSGGSNVVSSSLSFAYESWYINGLGRGPKERVERVNIEGSTHVFRLT